MEVIDLRFEAFVGSIKPYNYTSQWGEDSAIEAIFARIGETNRWVCECGAGDGLFMSNSRKLIEDGWNAVLIEADPGSYLRLGNLYRENDKIKRDPKHLSLDDGFDKILADWKAPVEIDLVVCDVDAGDYWLINSLLTYRPRVLMVEFDPNADPDFIPEPNGPGQAGLNAIIKLGYGKLYAAVCKTWCNVIFVRQDLADKLMEEGKNEKTMVHGHWIGDNEAVSRCPECQVQIAKMRNANRQLAELLESDVTFGEPRERIIPQPKDHSQSSEVSHCHQCKAEVHPDCLHINENGQKFCFHCACAEARKLPYLKDHDDLVSSIEQIVDEAFAPTKQSLQEAIDSAKELASGIKKLEAEPESDPWKCVHGQGFAWKQREAIGCYCCGRTDIRLLKTKDRHYYCDVCEAEGGIPQPKDRAKPNYVNPLSLDRNKGKTGLTAAISDLPGAQGYRANGIHSNGTGMIKIAAAMSTPRLGFLSNSDCILAALAQFGIPLARGEGAYWAHSLSRSIESGLKHKPDYILTLDYDTAFNASDVAKLVCFLDDNPGIEVAIPLQQKREGGELLASSDGPVDLSQPGIPVRQGHFGLTLFRTSVFDKISKPWFYERPGPDGSWNEGRIDADIGFWENCRNHGVSMYLALNVVVGHLELVNTWPDQQLKPFRQTLNDWRAGDQKPPKEAFSRERIAETVEHIQQLEMKG